MLIQDGLTIEDKVSGLKLTFIKGKTQNRLHVQRISEPIVGNRDFWFALSGEFDGTGSGFLEEPEKR